jgi:hypothetical protein
MILMNKHRRDFLETQNEMPDSQFLAIVNASAVAAPYVIMVRTIIGELCKIPPEKIHPDTDTGFLYKIGPSSLKPWDDLCVILQLEDLLSIEFTDEDHDRFPPFLRGWRFFRWGQPNWGGFGEYTIAAGEYLVQLLGTRKSLS